MAYAAVTSLMETLSRHFLQSQPGLPLEDLEAQIRVGNENLGLLQQILEIGNDGEDAEAEMREDEASSSIKACLPCRLHGIFNNEAVKQTDYYPKKKKLIKSEKLQQQLADLDANEKIVYGKQQLAWDTILLTSRLREVGELKQRIVSLHQNQGLLQQSLDKSEIAYDDARVRVMKDLEDQIREANEKVYGKQQLAWDTILLTSRLREMAQLKQNILSLHQNLGLLQQSLEKSEIPYDDARVRVMKDLEAQIRDASFKLEEMIEMELTAIYLSKDSRLHVTACLLRLHQIFNEAQKQTDYHRNELIRLAKAASSQNQRLTDVKGSSRHDLVHKQIVASNFSKKASKFDRGMVGCEKLFEKILDQLLTQRTTKGRQVLSIVGMGGIGKTTLAHKVYEHPSVTSHFDKQAWITVSQEYNVEQMLRCLVGCVIAASRDEFHEQSVDNYQEMLYKCLKGQRYLIVIDDIWNITAWDSVQRCFLDDNKGSCILLTSRLNEVAEYASSSGNSITNMPFLDADESWSLYCKVFGKIEFPSKFEQIGRDIVNKCKGLPLAITIVASLLSKMEEEEEKWKNVAKSVMGDSSDACSRILYLSYNQLPHHLKACFLYFAIFKEDYEISVKELVRLWSAEGFLNLEKVARECLQDLVDRSLVIVSKHSYNGEMKRIRIHDLLRDLCLREARHENLWNVNGVQKHCRWLSVTSIWDFYRKVRSEDEFFHKYHSFHLYDLDYSWGYYMPLLLPHMKLLRVLDMRNNNYDGLICLNVLANLVHLRYLALYTTGTLDGKFFEHWNGMQTLIVGYDDAILYFSELSGIWKMPLLKNFCIGTICLLETPSVVCRNLENISWLDSKLCTKELFTMIPNLKTLGVDGGKYANSPDCFYNFVHLEQLEKLSMKKLVDLNLVMCSISWATSLPNLKKLSLLKSNLQWSELGAISMLPNLEVLKLIDACKGRKWETSDGGFHRLKRLVIKETFLECWIVMGDHFPMLESLEISDCSRLEEIPCGFVDITTLALIQISNCRYSLEASAKWIQEEQSNNYGNDALLVRY